MSTLSEKGQVTIPKEFRDKLGLKPGSEVNFKLEDGKLVIVKEKVSFDDYEGFLGDESTDKVMEELRGEKE